MSRAFVVILLGILLALAVGVVGLYLDVNERKLFGQETRPYGFIAALIGDLVACVLGMTAFVFAAGPARGTPEQNRWAVVGLGGVVLGIGSAVLACACMVAAGFAGMG